MTLREWLAERPDAIIATTNFGILPCGTLATSCQLPQMDELVRLYDDPWSQARGHYEVIVTIRNVDHHWQVRRKKSSRAEMAQDGV